MQFDSRVRIVEKEIVETVLHIALVSQIIRYRNFVAFVLPGLVMTML